MPRSSCLIRRAIVDTPSGPVPSVPAGWDCIVENGAKWVTIYPRGRVAYPGVFMHAYLAVRISSNGCWALFGPKAWLDAIRAQVTNSWDNLPALRADNGAVATAIKNAWVDDRPPGDSSSIVGVRRRMAGFLSDDGETSGGGA